MTDFFLCPSCGFELPGTAEMTEDCFFCGWKFSEPTGSSETPPTTTPETAVTLITSPGMNSERGYETARLIIQDWHTGESYRKMAKRLGVKKSKLGSAAAALCNVANGNESQPAVLVLLGLEPEMKPAPTCTNPTCEGYGQPHTYNCETHQVKPNPTRPGRHQIRLAASVTKEQRDALRELAAEEGKTWTEYCQLLADVYIEYREG